MSRDGEFSIRAAAGGAGADTAPEAGSFPAEAFTIAMQALYGKKWVPGQAPKIRAVDAHYEQLGSKRASLGGANQGTRVKKKEKASHVDRSNIYYRETLAKQYGSTVRNSTAICELTAAHMMNMANDGIHEPSKVYIIKGRTGDPEVAVRFHKDFTTIEQQEADPDRLAEIDAGAALAQSLWIGDGDGYNCNLGTLSGSKMAVRIDFDLAFSDTIHTIIDCGVILPSIYNKVVDSLSRKSFADELE